jgi:release factor glutamine methyltransferase
VTVREALREGERLIAGTGSDEARLEAELLLCHALGIDRVRLYQALEDEIDPERRRAYQELIERRLAHEPTAYITGHKEFFGLGFEVRPSALIPRPETETLVELAIGFARGAGRPLTIADIGTGSGIIAVALAKELPDAQVIATDISDESLALARRNALRHGLGGRITFAKGDLLAALPGPVDVIAANLPYVPTGEWEGLPPEIRDHEPRSGLDGGPDGLRAIERLLADAPAYLNAGGALFEEIDDDQGTVALGLARRYFPEAQAEVRQDLAGRDRVLEIRLP